MEGYHISAFIDDQLELEEKIQFVETVHADKGFKDETLSYLYQERLLRAPAVHRLPKVVLPSRPTARSWGWFRQLGGYGLGLATAMLFVFLLLPGTPAGTPNSAYRFVIYEPDVRSAELVGSFSDWRAMKMQPSGSSGYWEITLELPPGEHRYSFLLDKQRRVADPTRAVREHDDFGGANSIISIEPNITA
jgi:hypothetical protein